MIFTILNFMPKGQPHGTKNKVRMGVRRDEETASTQAGRKSWLPQSWVTGLLVHTLSQYLHHPASSSRGL